MTNDIIAIIALLISAGSFFIAAGSFLVARRSLKLSETNASAGNPNLVPYLIDAFAVNSDKENTKLYAFSVAVSNRSDNDNAISALELRITYVQDNHSIGNLLFRHDEALGVALELQGKPPFSVPRDVGAHRTVAGWALFEVDKTLIVRRYVEGYRIRILDSHGLVAHLDSVILQERETDE